MSGKNNVFACGLVVSGWIKRSMKFSTTDAGTACKCFKTLFPEGRIEKVDGRDVVAFCVNCGCPIFDGDVYVPCGDDDGFLCSACAVSAVNKDMATGLCLEG